MGHGTRKNRKRSFLAHITNFWLEILLVRSGLSNQVQLCAASEVIAETYLFVIIVVYRMYKEGDARIIIYCIYCIYCIYVGLASGGDDTVKHAAHYVSY